MKNIRKQARKIALILGLSLLFVSCSQYDSINTETKENINISKIFTRDVKNNSGEELFKGIFFSKGKIADGLVNINNSYSYNLINNLDTKQTEQYDIEIENFISNIDKKYPDFLMNFKHKIESGSHIVITEAITEGAKMLFETYIDKYVQKNQKENFVNEISKIDINNYINPETKVIDYEKFSNDISKNPNFNLYSESCVGAVLGVVLVVAAYVLVVHAAAAMTYVGVTWVAYSYAAVRKGVTITNGQYQLVGSIEEEMLINEIAENLNQNQNETK